MFKHKKNKTMPFAVLKCRSCIEVERYNVGKKENRYKSKMTCKLIKILHKIFK